MRNLHSLSLLKDAYTSDDEEHEHEGEKIISSRNVHEFPELPVPETLINFMNDETESSEIYDNQDLHDGRIRSFPHERGNWATSLYVSIQNVEPMKTLCSKLLPYVQSIGEFHCCSDFHVSFSKTVVLRHHWIQLFVEGVREDIKKCQWFPINFEELEVFVNDERTRTFLALKVKSGHQAFLQLVKCADKNLSEFKLPLYYENPSFHASILWCVGDKEKHLNAVKPALQKHFEELRMQNPHVWCVDVKEVYCRVGNRLHKFSLS